MSFKVGDKVLFGRSLGERTLGEVMKVNRATLKVKQLESRGTMKSHPIGTLWTVPHSLATPAPAGATPAVTTAPPAPTTPAPGSQRAQWESLAPRYGLPADAFGKTIWSMGTEFRIADITPKRPKYPVECVRVSDGKRFKFAADTVLSALTPRHTAPTAPAAPARLHVGTPVTFEAYSWSARCTARVTGVVTHVDALAGEVEVFSSKTPRNTQRLPTGNVAVTPKRPESDILNDIACAYSRLDPEALTCDGEISRTEVARKRAALNRALAALQRELGRNVSSSEAFQLTYEQRDATR